MRRLHSTAYSIGSPSRLNESVHDHAHRLLSDSPWLMK